MLNSKLMITAFVLLFASDAFAVLGGDVSSVSKTQKAMPGVARKATLKADNGSDLYSIQELETGGIKIREYVSSSGKIFAVSWRGVREPDLAVLFGKYFPEYNSEQSKQTPSRARAARVQTSEIIVKKAGHMRDMRGLAYVLELLPPGVNVGELQ